MRRALSAMGENKMRSFRSWRVLINLYQHYEEGDAIDYRGDAYAYGVLPPRYPVPATINVSDTATCWLLMKHWGCAACGFNWSGALEYARDTMFSDVYGS
jgi:hypothetical protein